MQHMRVPGNIPSSSAGITGKSRVLILTMVEQCSMNTLVHTVHMVHMVTKWHT